jgi:hypothetical protein
MLFFASHVGYVPWKGRVNDGLERVWKQVDVV